MINNFICDNCDHYFVCEKLSKLMQFHENAKKNLGITLTMDDCMDYNSQSKQDEIDEN